MSDSEKKKKKKEKFEKNYNILTRKDYKELSNANKRVFDFAKENNLIVARKKEKLGLVGKKITVFDPVDYRQIPKMSFGIKTTSAADAAEKKLERKKNKEAEDNIHNLPKRRTFSTNYGTDVGLKPDMSNQYTPTRFNKGGSVGYTQRWKKARKGR